MSWQFHFRNFDTKNKWIGVYHMGCGMAPWHDGRPRCWSVDNLPTNPGGGHDSVYVPSDWVVHFDEWFALIVDGLKLIADLGLFIASEGEDEEALLDAISDIMDIEKDAVKAAAARDQVNLGELVKQAEQSFDKSCAAIFADPARIRQMAAEMGLGSHWAFIAGDTYKRAIHDDSKFVDNYGWTVLASEADATAVQWIANHAFLHKGHIIQAFPPEAEMMLEAQEFLRDVRAGKPFQVVPGTSGLLWQSF